MEEIINRVAKSPLISIDLEEYIHPGDCVIFDMKDVLHEGLILREKEFRTFLKTNDWSVYRNKNVGLVCSTDAIIPTWAYMLVVVKMKEFANLVTAGAADEIEKSLINQAINTCLKNNDLEGKKVVIKGCGSIKNVAYAYTMITEKLFPKVSSLMYGEPCSTVPIFKKQLKK